MFMFFWTVISMAATYYDIYVVDFTFTLYGDWFCMGINRSSTFLQVFLFSLHSEQMRTTMYSTELYRVYLGYL